MNNYHITLCDYHRFTLLTLEVYVFYYTNRKTHRAVIKILSKNRIEIDQFLLNDYSRAASKRTDSCPLLILNNMFRDRLKETFTYNDFLTKNFSLYNYKFKGFN